MELVIGALVAVLSFLLGAVLRPFLTGYSQKKGENLATHEDIDKLVVQVKEVTTTTEEIKAQISTGVWDKQKRWEMKREVLFDAAKRLAELDDALLTFASMRIQDDAKKKTWAVEPPSPEEQLNWAGIKDEKVIRWGKASTAFDESRLFVGIVCGKDAKKPFEDLGGFINIIVPKIAKDSTVYETSRAELIKKILLAQKAIRKELEVDA